MQPLIFRGIRYAAVIEHPGDGGFSVSLRKKGEYFPHGSSGFRINEQMSFLLRVFLIAIECEGTDVKAAFPAVGQHGTDIFRHILQIPFVDQPVDLAGLLVAPVGCIRVVNQTDKADPPKREQPVDVLFHQLQFTGKPGLTFAEDDIEPVRFGVIQQAGEFRAVPIGTRVIIIAVNVIYFPPLPDGIFQQHGFLIADAAAVLRFMLLAVIFL